MSSGALRHRLVTGPGLLLSASLLGYALAFVTSTLQARLLGPDGRGVIAMALAPAGVLGTLLCLNAPDYYARRAALADDLRALSRDALGVSFVTGVVFAVPYVVFASLWQPVGSVVWWLLVTCAVTTVVNTYGSCLLGIGVGAAAWPLVALLRILPGLVSIVGLCVAFAFHAGPLPVGILVIVTGLVVPLMALGSARFRPTEGHLWDRGLAALRYGVRAWPAGAIALVSQRIDLLVVAAIATKPDVGFYALGTSLAAVLTAVSNAIAMPTRNAVAQGNLRIIPGKVSTAMWATLVLVVLATGAVPLYIWLFLGPGFGPLYLPAMILILAEVPLAGAVVLNQVLLGHGLPTKPLSGAWLALVITGSGAVVLYPLVGLTGAAGACLLGNVGNLVGQFVAVRRHVDRAPGWSYLIPPFQRGKKDAL